MIDPAPLPAFLLVSAVVVLTPGSDVLLLVRSSLAGGRRTGWASFLGIHLSNVILVTAAVTGLGALAARHPDVLGVVTVLGGLYLLWLAVVCARSAVTRWRLRRGQGRSASGSLATVDVPTAGEAFTRGFVTNVTNPKVLIFYVSFLPQFMGSAASALAQGALLAVIFVALAMAWEATLVVLAARSRTLLEHTGFAVALDVLSAVIFTVLAGVVLIAP